MQRLKRLAGAFGVALAVAAALGSTVGFQAASAQAEVVGHVYVNDNTAGTNTIAGFARHADGTLTDLPGSPFAAGGAGAGATTPSQGALQRSADGRYLLAVDAGSNQISVLRIRPDGSLRLVEDGPVSSGGTTPVSIAVHGALVYVANAGNGGANYAGFRLDDDGHLVQLAQATYAVPDGSGLGDVLFNADGTRLVGVRVTTSLIDSFAVDATGRLDVAPGSPFAAQAPGPFGSAFRPDHPAQLFVSNAHGGAGNGSVSAFHDAANGRLMPIGASPFADHQTAPCWVDITPNGRYLFAVNTASASVSGYAIAPDGTLTLLGSTTLNDAAGLSPFDIRVSPGGQYAYVVDSGRDALSALAVHGGSVTELAASPIALPAGAAPFGLVVD